MIPAVMIDRNRALALELVARPAAYSASLIALAWRFLNQWGVMPKKNPAARPG